MKLPTIQSMSLLFLAMMSATWSECLAILNWVFFFHFCDVVRGISRFCTW